MHLATCAILAAMLFAAMANTHSAVEENARDQHPHTRLGKPAPAVEFRLLDGSLHALSAHRGREVVVMDFWASWCPPCRMTLPLLNTAVKRWGGSNVVFYAVNRGEPRTKIEAFLKTNPIEFPIIQDAGELAEQFEVSGIPHLLVLDTNGVIQFVHVGYDPLLGAVLDEQLPRILAGEELAKRVLKEWDGKPRQPVKADAGYKAQPIPCGPDAFTARDYRALNAEFCRRMFTELYLHTRTGAAGEQEILPYLAEYERFVVGSDEPLPSAQELLEGAQALVKKGYHHPVVRYCLGAMHRKLGTRAGYEAAQREMEACYEAFSTPQYDSSWRRYGCAMRMLWNMRDLGQRKKMQAQYDEIKQKALAAAAAAFTDGSFSNIHIRIPMNELLEALDTCNNKVISTAEYAGALAALQDRMPPALYHYAQAWAAYARGWRARGGGFADTVQDEDWEVFHDAIDEARAHAEKAWAEAPCPEIATLLIHIARCRPKERNEWRRWFDEAVALQMDYLGAYRALEFTIYPRWHGSHMDMLRLGEECLATRRFDTRVPAFYEEVLRDISLESDDHRAVFRRPSVYSNLCAMLDAYQAQISTNGFDVSAGLTKKAFAAWSAGRYDDAARFLQELEGSPAPAPLRTFRIPARVWLGEIAIFTSPRGDAFAKARAMVEAGQDHQAMASLEALLQVAGLPDAERFIIEDELVWMRTRISLASGARTSLMPPTNLAGWTTTSPAWTMKDSGAIFCPGCPEGDTEIICKTPLGSRVELTGEIELATGSSEGILFIGWPHMGDYSRMQFEIDRRQQQVRAFHKHAAEQKVHMTLRKHNPFYLRLNGDKITLRINDACVLDEVAFPQTYARRAGAPAMFGLRNTMTAPQMGFGINNLQVQPLSSAEEDPKPMKEGS